MYLIWLPMNNPNGKDEIIQALRFAAALLVLFTHVGYYIHERVDSSFVMWNGGLVGVPIFFIISGIVMQMSAGNSYSEEGSVRSFVINRFARIFPLYWFVTSAKIVIAILLPAYVLHNTPTIHGVITSFILFPAYNSFGKIEPIHGVGWTLLHEMFFYGVFSIALMLRVPPARFCSIVILAAWLVGRFVNADYAWIKVYSSNINLMFLFGVWIAVFRSEIFRLRKYFISVSGIICLVYISEFFSEANSFISEFRLSAVFIVLIVLNVRWGLNDFFRRLFSTLGDGSYSLYLLHPIVAPLVLVLLKKAGFFNNLTIFTIACVVCVSISVYFFNFAERPSTRVVRNWLRKF